MAEIMLGRLIKRHSPPVLTGEQASSVDSDIERLSAARDRVRRTYPPARQKAESAEGAINQAVEQTPSEGSIAKFARGLLKSRK